MAKPSTSQYGGSWYGGPSDLPVTAADPAPEHFWNAKNKVRPARRRRRNGQQGNLENFPTVTE